jgi:hypothetical protein
MMHPMEPNVRADQVSIRIVLDISIHECARCEGIKELRAYDIRRERSIRQFNLVAIVVEVQFQMVVWFQIQIASDRLLPSIVEITPTEITVTTDLPTRTRREVC